MTVCVSVQHALPVVPALQIVKVAFTVQVFCFPLPVHALGLMLFKVPLNKMVLSELCAHPAVANTKRQEVAIKIRAIFKIVFTKPPLLLGSGPGGERRRCLKHRRIEIVAWRPPARQ
jgi:hypothetical protein